MTGMILAPEQTYVRTNDVVTTDMDGEIVMMHVEKGAYFAISGCGVHLWSQLEDPKKLPDLIASIEEEFEVDKVDDLEGIVSRFLTDLLEQGLVVAAD